jgi:hypothetical protein
MSPNGDKLTVLLKQWRDIEPGPGFETGVWRRIRRGAAERPSSRWTEVVLQWLGAQPAWACVAAVIAGVLIGTQAGLRSLPGRDELAFLRPDTLTAKYMSMISGGSQ